ncbi:YIP1 family protein [Thermosulfurimonas marina]|uniref:YIP1 family protein n=1 Tax=Thermosulfurimonas marina TaxID=2047767 RepID=A0A6H1WQG2_9BACT|nr:Yip1 family protein [Thermosulfurimonas marina]QJA05398.1 YIP1 family protein [Thermosulfurimonas marina]
MDFFQRVKRIVFSPREEWPVIESEDLSLSDLYGRYALILIGASSLAKALGLFLFGFPMGHMGVNLPGPLLVGQALFEVLVQTANLLLASLVVHYLAPHFGGESDFLAANKLVVFSSTPGWLGGLLGIFPPLRIFEWLFGLYGLYLFYLGAPVILKISPEKKGLFLAICLVVLLALFFVIGLLLMPFHPTHF